MSALRESKLKDGKTLHHRNSFDDEQLAGGISNNEPLICQPLEGMEWCDNVLFTIIVLVYVTCERNLARLQCILP